MKGQNTQSPTCLWPHTSLPKGWAWASLPDLLSLDIGFAFKSAEYVSDGIRLLRGENIAPGRLRWEDTKHWSGTKTAEVTHLFIKEGDIILAMDRPLVSAGLKIARAKRSDLPCLLVQRMARFCLFDVEMTSFVYQALTTDVFIRHLIEGQTGTQLPHISGKRILDFQIPLPPLEEQQRIVAALDERLSELDASVASLERAERNLVHYRAAVLAAACSGKLAPTEADLARRAGRSYESADQLLARILAERRKANTKAKYEEPAQPDTSKLPKLPEGWVWTSLESLPAQEKNSVTDGPFGSKLKTEHYTASGPRVIRLQNIGDGQFIDAYSHISKEHFSSLTKHHVFPADVVIGALGERPPRSCIVPNGIGPALVKADCIRFKPHPEMMTPEFLNYALNSSLLKSQGEAIVHGVGRPRLNLGEILSLAVPLPPLAEQSRIVAEVDRHLSRADALAAAIAQAKRRAQRLRRAILAAAFQGRLVPQDPNDEPASVLLDRIRAQAATAEAAAATTPRRGRPPAQPAAPVASASPPAMTPKRRGRPPGSKNRPKA